VVTPPTVGGDGADRDTALWKSVEGLGSADAYRAYLKQFPGGTYAGIAKLKIASLAPASAAPAPRPSFDVTSVDQTMFVSGASPVQPAVGVFAKPAIPPKPVEPAYPVGDVFSDCPACPKMVVVPSGSFMMGSPASEPNRFGDEGPVHRVLIRAPFAVGKYEVTFSEWDACVSDGGCDGYRPSDNGWGRDRRPVINVSWADAKRYVSWLSGETGKDYRLLSESEWEYVARAGTTTAYHTGSSISGSQAKFGGSGTVPVGRFASNGFGLHDVHGNVWEWTEDCWAEDYENASADGAVNKTGACSRRVLRGGSWNYEPRNLRSALRGWNRIDLRDGDFGFRVARTLTR